MYIRLSDGRVAKRLIVPENVSLPRNPSDDTLAALGYARIHPTPRPDGDVVTQGQPEQGEDGKWYQTWEVRSYTAEEIEQQRLEQEAQEQAEIAQRFTYKTDIWQRVTEEEAEVLDAALNAAPAKQRRMWDDSLSVEHSSDYYVLLKAQMVGVFGEARTDEILAPSEG